MRGFHIRKPAARFFHRLLRRRRRLRHSSILTWMRRKASAFLNCPRPGTGYIRLGRKQPDPLRFEVPKGHLAVYVGQKDDDFCPVLVPVVYLNHPLFGRLLSEAEERFGFEYPGRIKIPCPVSEFEKVTTRIEAAKRRCAAGTLEQL